MRRARRECGTRDTGRPVRRNGARAEPPAPAISRFDARDVGVFVGERTQLTAVFSGDSAEIDGVGPVTSGTPVDTPVLPASRTFTLTVHKGGQAARATVTVAVRYRARIRQLPDAAVARKAHVAVSLPDGSALVMGGNTSESIDVPDTNTSSRFDAASEAFTRGPDLAFSAAVDTGFTILLPLRTGFLLAGGGINAGIGLQTPGTLLSQTFDPSGQTFTRAGDLQVHHLGTGSGTLLADGRVLLSGGGLPGIAETEVYDPGVPCLDQGLTDGHRAAVAFRHLASRRPRSDRRWVRLLRRGRPDGERDLHCLGRAVQIPRRETSPPPGPWRLRGRSTRRRCSPTAASS